MVVEDNEESAVVSNMKHPVSIPRKSPTKRVYQPDQYEDFLAGDRISSFNDIDDVYAMVHNTFQIHLLLKLLFVGYLTLFFYKKLNYHRAIKVS